MSGSGLLSVAGVEWAKLVAQMKVRILLAACVIAPFGFAVAMRVQSSLPVDTLFGRAVKESGLAVSLVVLGFAALWAFPVMTSVVGGDLFSSEDRYGTWKTVLTRSRSRVEVFAGKVLIALVFSMLAVSALAASSVAAGALVIGRQPLIDLSGLLIPSGQALVRVALAWASVPPALGFTAPSPCWCQWPRGAVQPGSDCLSSLGLTMQLLAFIDGPEILRRLLITSAFGAWHGLLAEPRYYGPVIHGTAVSGAYFVICLTMAYRMLRQRDIGG